MSCSVDLPEGARFCYSCGTTQGPPPCSSCGSPLVQGARFCMSCGAAQTSSAPAGVQPVAARRVTSVLFGDLVGFTALSEVRDHEETRELLTRYFDECRQIIVRYGGTVEKFIGDAVMAVWGVPTAHEDDAERAVRAGLELVNVVATMGEELAVPGLDMRVGIVTGEVAVTIGAEQQGMVAGDAVNTAARVQSAAAPGQVWVDETTRLLTSAAITYLDVGSHPLKGKVDPVPLWSVRAVVAAVGGAQRADGLEAPLVGRERELRLVKELFHSVEETQRPTLLVMVGEPGVGKSRIAWEYEKYVDGLSGTVRWHSGRCVAYGEGVAFFALAEAVRGRLRAVDPDSDVANEDPGQLLDEGLDLYVPDETERTWLRPRLGALLGIGSVGTFPREDLFSAWTAFFQRVGGDELPVVLVIDDAQHADDGLLQFVEHLLNVATFPCFIFLLTRPGLLEAHPTLATNRRSAVSHLAALSDDHVGVLLDGLVVGLPVQVRESLVARSEGVPLFAVETVRSLIDRDLVIPRGGQYVLADADTLDLDSISAPASLHALISARLDALAPEQRRLVDLASVVGNVFSRDQIVDLCGTLHGLADVDAALAGLVRLQILSQMASRLSADFGNYQFVQTVVRQVAYATLSRRDRRAAHLAVAAQTEAVTDASGDLAPIIAQHYLDAVEALPSEPDVPDLEAHAILHLERAAARARSLGGLTESAGHLLAALERAHDPALRARLESAVAWALVDAGEYAETVPHAVAAVEAFDVLEDAVSAGTAAAAHGAALTLDGDNAGACALLEPRWQALLDVPGADLALLSIGKVLCQASARFGDERRDVVDRRLQIAERIGDKEELADALTALSLSYSVLGSPVTARTLMSSAADLARTHHYPVALARCLSNLTVEYNLVDLDKAVEVGAEAVEVAGRAGVAMWQSYAGANLDLALFAAGRWAELDERLAHAQGTAVVDRTIHAALNGYLTATRGHEAPVPWGEGAAPESDDPSDTAWVAFAHAAEAQSRGDLKAALGFAVAAVDTMHELSGMSDDFVHMWPVAVELAMARDDATTVETLLEIVDSGAAKVLVPAAIRTHRTRFAGLRARGVDPEVVEALLREAIVGFAEWGSRHYQARAEGELGAWLAGRGRADEGAVLLEGARAVLTELGAVAFVAQLGERQPASS
ncbi:MAG TPA: adenylate/guanylate cyclase domain-containing protein [Nocardioides sp.]|uniref:adenylate/guanylate cyclase domain-containing protein n=1 Tax=Nocardioides sp. TaxID=35761 RepID=UPI002D7E30D1|nr:adenylate/guanylate cyclase domain-containing protein [Nocardioides sp.]HET6654367.1 adenylate/guanylate cyclase domain-containing protein [Nocardioides sp.]